jgi:hypothetical protein
VWKKIGFLLALPVLLYLISTGSLLLFGSITLAWVIVIVLLLWLVLPRLPGFIHRRSAKVWLVVGMIALVGLVPPTHLIASPLQAPSVWQSFLRFLVVLMPPAAVLVGALLLYSGLTLVTQRQPAGTDLGMEQPVPRRAHDGLILLTFIVLTLLIARLLYNIYWLMVWDSTTDPLGYLWLALPLLVSLLSGALLRSILPEKFSMAALYGLLVPLLLFAVSAWAMQPGFRQRTELRAARISQAIEAYARREGRYPQHLGQLVPQYTLSIPGPVILYQQDWCYDAGENYFRLAFVDREHWSSPELFPHIYIEQGAVPPQPLPCQAEIQAIFDSQPDYYRKNTSR